MSKNNHLAANRLAVASAIVLGGSIATEALGQSPAVTHSGASVILAVPAAEQQATNVADIATARPMPLPKLDAPDLGALEAPPVPQRNAGQRSAPFFSLGAPGNGVQTPVTVPEDDADSFEPADERVTAQEFGVATATAGPSIPYTTNRVDTGTITGALGNVMGNVSSTYPYRAVGKLYFRVPGTGPGTGGMVCTAALIKRGLVVTAAHCVAKFGGGAAGRFTGFQFVPAKYNTTAPYGTWVGEAAIVLASWLNGTDVCYARGITCQNDVAVIRLVAQAGAFPGAATGWLSYATGMYGFTAQNTTLVSELGYPASHDAGNIMQRTDSQGIMSPLYSYNTVWGSRQDGGSSGGPVIVNLGISGVLTNTALGSGSLTNTVIGVTSWEAVPVALKRQGASAFVAANIGTLVNAACIIGAVTRPACL